MLQTYHSQAEAQMPLPAAQQFLLLLMTGWITAPDAVPSKGKKPVTKRAKDG
jgi:hypothetical protein